MKYRALPGSELKFSEIGFGAWGIGGRSYGNTSYGDTDDAVSRHALSTAFERGITFYDTSNVYGEGHSEELIGDVFSSVRDQVVIASKAGMVNMKGETNYSPEYIRASLEGSLRRLRTDYVDLFQLHNPPPDFIETNPELVRLLEDLKNDGTIRAIGLSLGNPLDGLQFLDHTSFDCIQVNLSMLDIRAYSCGLLEKARTIGVGIIARTPMCFGFLAGHVNDDASFPEGDHRSAWPREQLRRWREGGAALMKITMTAEKQSQAQAALRFCLSFESVTTVIPGILRNEEAVENAEASDLGPLPDDIMNKILAVHETEDFFVSRRA